MLCKNVQPCFGETKRKSDCEGNIYIAPSGYGVCDKCNRRLICLTEEDRNVLRHTDPPQIIYGGTMLRKKKLRRNKIHDHGGICIPTTLGSVPRVQSN